MTCGVRLAICAAAPAPASGGGNVHRHKAHFIARFQLANRVSIASMTVTGQTNPPDLGRRGRDHRHIAGEIPPRQWRTGCRGCSTEWPASPPLSRTHSGFGPIRPVRLELKYTSHSVAKKKVAI